MLDISYFVLPEARATLATTSGGVARTDLGCGEAYMEQNKDGESLKGTCLLQVVVLILCRQRKVEQGRQATSRNCR